MKASWRNRGIAIASLLALAACGEGGNNKGAAVAMAGYLGAQATVNGDSATADRSGDNPAGITLSRAPVLVHFTVEGDNIEIRTRRGRDKTTAPAQQDNIAVLDGRTSVTAFSRTGQTVKVNITSVVPCAEARDQCRAAMGAAADDDSSDAATPAPASAAPAAPATSTAVPSHAPAPAATTTSATP